MKTILRYGAAWAILGLAVAPIFGQTQTTTSSTTYIQASKLIGTKVKASSGDEVGVIKDVILDNNGCMLYTVVSTGGTASRLTNSSKTVAVPWAVYSTTSDPSVVTVRVEKEKIYNAPVFEYSRINEYSSSGWVNTVYSHYGVSANVGGGTSTNVSGSTTTTGAATTTGTTTTSGGLTTATASPGASVSPMPSASMTPTATPAASASPSASAATTPSASASATASRRTTRGESPARSESPSPSKNKSGTSSESSHRRTNATSAEKSDESTSESSASPSSTGKKSHRHTGEEGTTTEPGATPKTEPQ